MAFGESDGPGDVLAQPTRARLFARLASLGRPARLPRGRPPGGGIPDLMERPERLTVPTCIGCGAMGRFGTCETGCREEKLELVRAAAHAAIASLEATAEKAGEAFREVAERLLSGSPEGDRQSQAAYCSLQEQARAALAEHVDADDREIDWDEPAEAATTWWCPDCGAIDAPQPCLGICVWRPVEWVRRDLYERERERALVAHARQRALRQVLRRIAFVTPRPGQWERNWEALQTQAARSSPQ